MSQEEVLSVMEKGKRYTVNDVWKLLDYKVGKGSISAAFRKLRKNKEVKLLGVQGANEYVWELI